MLADLWVGSETESESTTEEDYPDPVELPYDQQMGAPGVVCNTDLDNPHDWNSPPEHPLDKVAYRVGSHWMAQTARKSSYSRVIETGHIKKMKPTACTKLAERNSELQSASKERILEQIFANPSTQGHVMRKWDHPKLSHMQPSDIKALLLKLGNAILCIPASARMQVNFNMMSARTGSGAVLCDLVPILEYERFSDALLCLVISALNEVQNYNINDITEIVMHGLDFDNDSLCLTVIDEYTGYSLSGTNNLKYDSRLAAETWEKNASMAGLGKKSRVTEASADLDALNRLCCANGINIDLWMKIMVVNGVTMDRHPTSLYTVLNSNGNPVVGRPGIAPGQTRVVLTRVDQVGTIKGWKDDTVLNEYKSFRLSVNGWGDTRTPEVGLVRIHRTIDTVDCSDVAKPTDFNDNGSNGERIALEKILSGRGSGEVVIHKFAIPMTKDKMLCLRNDTWLNDEVISFYLSMLQVRNQHICAADPTSSTRSSWKDFL